jgi:hypothetical protein
MTVHPYLRFRIRLARHAVAQLAARLRRSAEIVVVLLGPALLGALAFAAMPAMLAASYPLVIAVPLLFAHGVAMSLPVALLRPQVVPSPVRAWLAPLPVPPRLERLAALAVAGLLVAPLALVYGVSLSIWLMHMPSWLQPARAIAGTVFSLLLTWTLSSALLLDALRLPRPASANRRAGFDAYAGAQRYSAQAARGPLFLWRQLFWLPLWRNGSLAGARQAALLAAAIGAILLWMLGPALIPRPAGAVVGSLLLVLLVHEADTASRAQRTRVRAIAAPWPVSLDALGRQARAMLLVGAAAPLAVLTGAGHVANAWVAVAGRIYLALAWAMPPLLVLTPTFTPRGRMALVALALMLLCATGSAIWN